MYRNGCFYVYTDLIISTIVDLLILICGKVQSLYGLDNFYYRRCGWYNSENKMVYTDLIISTIVDSKDECKLLEEVYTDLIISTIVDSFTRDAYF